MKYRAFKGVAHHLYLGRREERRRFSVYVLGLIGIFLMLATLGLLNLASASGDMDLVYRQGTSLGIGMIAIILFGWVIPIRYLEEISYYFMGFVCILLLVVLIGGEVSGGSRRWLSIGPLRGQPSEFVKIAVAMTVGKFFKMKQKQAPFDLVDLIPLAAVLGLIFGAIFIQPDFGTAGVCVLIAAFQLLFVPIRVSRMTLVIGAAASAAIAYVGWHYLLLQYQKDRVLTFLNPEIDPTGTSYNSIQSLVAIGSGGLFGKGYLNGTQAHLKFLPSRHTDFAFSVFAEENGFWICLALFAAFTFIAVIGVSIARRARDYFSMLLATGVSANIFLQFLINVAMVLGSFPVVGITLPFFSFGGSSLITICASFGILIGIERENAGKLGGKFRYGRTGAANPLSAP